jgi:hypothetical protein
LIFVFWKIAGRRLPYRAVTNRFPIGDNAAPDVGGGQASEGEMEQAGGTRPGFGETVSNAFRSTGQAAGQMPVLFFSAYFGLLAVSFATQYFGYNAIAASKLITGGIGVANALVLLAGMFAFYALNAFFLAPVAVAMHRFILRNEVNNSLAIPSRDRTRLFATWLVIIAAARVLSYVPGAFGSVMGDGRILAGLFAYICLLAVGVVGVRLSLLFPAVAVDDPAAGFFARAHTSWERTRGHFWFLFGLTLVIGFIVAIPFGMVISAITLSTVAGSIAAGGAPPKPDVMLDLMTSAPVLFLNALQYVVLTAVAAAGLSWIYRGLVEQEAKVAVPA